jgi:GNAT superfamily N-acetyltransferase
MRVSSATMTTDAADRVHEGLIAGFAATASRIPGTRVQRRDGYTAAVCPVIPLPGFNGLWIERDLPRPVIESAADEVSSDGIPAFLLVRAGTTGAVADTALSLGFRLEESVPAMVVEPGTLVPAAPAGVEIRRTGMQDRHTAVDLGAAGFGGPHAIFDAMYTSIFATPGFAVYEAWADGQPVSTACSFRTHGSVGIFNVATPEAHRRHGYGRAVTERAIRDAFDAGADLAWLQASELGARVYHAMGFHDVDRYDIYSNAEPGAAPN